MTDRYCSVCKSCEHEANHCSEREPRKVCNECFDMSWRVRGLRCGECGLRFCQEPPVTIDDQQTHRSDRGVWA